VTVAVCIFALAELSLPTVAAAPNWVVSKYKFPAPPGGLSAGSTLRRSTLPVADELLLRRVEAEVKALKVPANAQPAMQLAGAGPATQCSFLGGLVSAALPGRCCENVQVITHKLLSSYGLEQASCKPGWQCNADGQTPTQDFEDQSVSELCGQSGCVPAVVGAMRSNWMTAKGAVDFNDICSSLATVRSSSSTPEQRATAYTMLNGKLRGTSEDQVMMLRDWQDNMRGDTDDERRIYETKMDARDDETDDRATKLDCQEEVCAVKKRRKELCNSKNETDRCYKSCCYKAPGCFAGEATADVHGRGAVPMAKLRVGDRVLVEDQGQFIYEPVLSFLHSTRPAAGKQWTPVVAVLHSYGEFHATENHIVFVAGDSEGSRVSKLVGRLVPGDQLLVAKPGDQRSMTLSRILALTTITSHLGAYAPLTPSGTIVVDGVVASSYASSSVHKDLSHRTAHAFLLPVRLYHLLGLGKILEPLWERTCGQSRYWLCQGGHLDAEATEEMHPYLAIMFKGLKFDWFLSEQ